MLHERCMGEEKEHDAFQDPRYYSEIDLQRLKKEGKMGRDEQGFFTYEEVVSPTGEHILGERFYIEESYRTMEHLIHDSQVMWEDLQQIRGQNEIEEGARILTLVAMELRYSRLIDLRRGTIREGEFLSPRQIQEFAEDETTLEKCLEYLGQGGWDGYLGFTCSLAKAFFIQWSSIIRK